MARQPLWAESPREPTHPTYTPSAKQCSRRGAAALYSSRRASGTKAKTASRRASRRRRGCAGPGTPGRAPAPLPPSALPWAAWVRRLPCLLRRSGLFGRALTLSSRALGTSRPSVPTFRICPARCNGRGLLLPRGPLSHIDLLLVFLLLVEGHQLLLNRQCLGDTLPPARRPYTGALRLRCSSLLLRHPIFQGKAAPGPWPRRSRRGGAVCTPQPPLPRCRPPPLGCRPQSPAPPAAELGFGSAAEFAAPPA